MFAESNGWKLSGNTPERDWIQENISRNLVSMPCSIIVDSSFTFLEYVFESDLL